MLTLVGFLGGMHNSLWLLRINYAHINWRTRHINPQQSLPVVAGQPKRCAY